MARYPAARFRFGKRSGEYSLSTKTGAAMLQILPGNFMRISRKEPQMTITKETFMFRLNAAEPKERVSYHVGCLMADRVSHEKYTPEANARAAVINDVANAAWEAAGMKWDKNLSPEGQWRSSGNAICRLVQ